MDPEPKLQKELFQRLRLNLTSRGRYDIVRPVDHQFYNFQSVSKRSIRERGTLRNSFIEYEYARDRLINVATPERTSRLRLQSADRLKLVQIFSGGSYYPWLLERFAQHGYRVGVIGSQFSLKNMQI